jgi:hypothetical protein
VNDLQRLETLLQDLLQECDYNEHYENHIHDTYKGDLIWAISTIQRMQNDQRIRRD